MSDFSLTLVLQIKTSKIINDMAKVSKKSEKITAFGGIFFVLDKFDSILSSVIDSHLGLRSRLIGYQYSEIIRAVFSFSDSSPYLPSGAERQGSTNSTSTPTSHTNLFGNTDKTTFFIDASVYASRPYGVRGYWLMVGRITRLYD